MHYFHNLYLSSLPYVIWSGGTADCTILYRIVLRVFNYETPSGMTLAFESSRETDLDAMNSRRWTTATTAQVAEMLTAAYEELLFNDISASVDGYR